MEHVLLRCSTLLTGETSESAQACGEAGTGCRSCNAQLTGETSESLTHPVLSLTGPAHPSGGAIDDNGCSTRLTGEGSESAHAGTIIVGIDIVAVPGSREKAVRVDHEGMCCSTRLTGRAVRVPGWRRLPFTGHRIPEPGSPEKAVRENAR